jgi:hypothetical protein
VRVRTARAPASDVLDPSAIVRRLRGARAALARSSPRRAPVDVGRAMDFSAGGLFASLVVSTVGFGFFLYGKKASRPPQLVVGLVLMLFPYFIDGAWWQVGIASGVLGGLVVALRAGW